jgi:arginyl-tRNA synthetase
MFSLKNLKKQIINEINKYLPLNSQITADILEYPPNPEMGDIALPCFKIILIDGQKAAESAEILKDKLKYFVEKNPYIKETKTIGPYLNFVLNKEKITKEILTKPLRPLKPIGPMGPMGPIVIEYISPNSNKPLHLGHIRNGLIGEAISNILKKQGKKIIRTCLINDRGIHIAKSMLAYLKFGKEKTPKSANEKGDSFVGKFYVLFNEKVKKEPSLQDEAYKLLKKWEKGDKKIIALWKKMTKWVLQGFEETYKKLGIHFDKIYFESQIYKKGKKRILKELKNKNFEKDEKGNVIANLEKYGLPNKVVLRGDGTAVYATTDIELAFQRAKDYSFDKLIYVVASEQDLYFKQLFKIFEIIKAPFAKKLQHLNYGLILLPEGKLKSREGTTVDADTLIEELEKMVIKETQKRHSIKDGSAKPGSEALAAAALKFHILQVSPKSDIMFKPEESISLTGRTGVYIEYAYARIQSILTKANHIGPIGPIGPMGPISQILMQILKYEETLESSAENLDPSALALYLYELAKKFNDFYEKVPILNSPEPQRTQKILLIKKIAEILKEGMELLGITPLKQI